MIKKVNKTLNIRNSSGLVSYIYYSKNKEHDKMLNKLYKVFLLSYNGNGYSVWLSGSYTKTEPKC